MRKSGWAAAAGLGSVVLLLAACGGSSSPSNTASGAASSTTQATAAGSSAAAQATSASAAASASASAAASASKKAGGSSTPTPHHTAGPQPSSGAVTFPAVGTTIMIVQRSAIGFVLAEANGQVVYTYSKDKKDGSPTCTGSCADTWPAVTGVPKAGPADTFPGSFGVVKGAGGVEQITYNGYPLYLYKDAKPLSTAGNGIGGEWHVVMLSASDISGG
jgi:predicted lipoprotein with Yx(FWY)xxD motif